MKQGIPALRFGAELVACGLNAVFVVWLIVEPLFDGVWRWVLLAALLGGLFGGCRLVRDAWRTWQAARTHVPAE